MPFNADDQTQAPYREGCMTLTHEECRYVIDNCKEIEDAYVPVEPWDSPEASVTYILSNYAKLDDGTKNVNGDTYYVLMDYADNHHGINEDGIIFETEESPAE